MRDAEVHLLELKDVPETDDGEGGRPRRMSPRWKVCVLKDCGRLEWVLLISLVRCVWVERCVSLVNDSGGVCGCGWVVAGCAWGRVVEEGKQHVLS